MSPMQARYQVNWVFICVSGLHISASLILTIAWKIYCPYGTNVVPESLNNISGGEGSFPKSIDVPVKMVLINQDGQMGPWKDKKGDILS